MSISAFLPFGEAKEWIQGLSRSKHALCPLAALWENGAALDSYFISKGASHDFVKGQQTIVKGWIVKVCHSGICYSLLSSMCVHMYTYMSAALQIPGRLCCLSSFLLFFSSPSFHPCKNAKPSFTGGCRSSLETWLEARERLRGSLGFSAIGDAEN